MQKFVKNKIEFLDIRLLKYCDKLSFDGCNHDLDLKRLYPLMTLFYTPKWPCWPPYAMDDKKDDDAEVQDYFSSYCKR